MAQTTNRKLTKLAQQGQQYVTGNEDFDALDSMLSKLMSISMASGDRTISNTVGDPGVAGKMESQALGYKLTGTLTANSILTVPFTMPFLVWNATSGAYTITVKSGAGTTVEIAQGTMAWVYSDGTNVVAPFPPGALDEAAGDARYLKLSDAGDAATKNVGTGSGEVAAGDHTHSAFNFSGPVTNITVVDGIVTGAS